MDTTTVSPILAMLFAELVEGASQGGEAFMLNSGDVGLLRSLDVLSSADASHAVNGATLAAHAQHLRYGLSLMNRWAMGGGNPFADAQWDAAWTVGQVDDVAWMEIRHGLRDEAQQWQVALAAPREASAEELAGMLASVAHLAYHLGAIRQIDKATRGPRDGTFNPPQDHHASREP